MITEQQILDYLTQFIDVLITHAQSPEKITEAFIDAGYDNGYGQRKATKAAWAEWITSLATTTATPDAPGDFDSRSEPYPTSRAKLYYGFIMGAAFIHRRQDEPMALAQMFASLGVDPDNVRNIPNFLYQMLHNNAYSMVEARLEAFKNKDPLLVPFIQNPDVSQALTGMQADLAANGVNSVLVQSIHVNIQAVNARAAVLGPLVNAYRQHVNFEQAIRTDLQAYYAEHPQTALDFLRTGTSQFWPGSMIDIYTKYIGDPNQLSSEVRSEVQQLFSQYPALKENLDRLNEIRKLQTNVEKMKTLDEETQGCPDWLVAGLKAFEESSEYEAVKRARAERTLATSQDPQEKDAAQQYIAYYDAKQSLLNDCDAYEHHLRAEAKKAIDIRSKKYDSVPIKANVDTELKLYQQQKEQQEQQGQPKQLKGYEQGSAQMQAVGQVLAKLDELQTYRTKVQQAKDTDDLLVIGNELQTKTLLSAHRDTFGKAFIAKALTTIVTLGGALVYNRMKTGEFTNFASFDFGSLFESEGAKLKHKAVDVTADLRRKAPSSSLLGSAASYNNESHPTAGYRHPGDEQVRVRLKPLGPAPSSDPTELLNKEPSKGILKKP